MTILRNKIVAIALLAVGVTANVLAQTTSDDRAVLAQIQKKVAERKFTEVERELLNYLIAHPKDASGFALLAKLRLKQDRIEEAQSLSNRALSLNPNLLEAKLTAASSAYRLGEVVRSREILTGISESEVRDDATRLEIAEGLAVVGGCSKAKDLVDKLPARVRNAEALPVRAACLLEAGAKDDLLALLPAAKAAAGRNASVAVRFAEMLAKGGMLSETVDLLKVAVAGAPRDARALLMLAKTEANLSDVQRAKQHLARAAALVPDAAEVFFVASMIQSAEGKNSRAFELLEEAVQRDNRNVEYLTRFVVVAMRVNQAAKAVRGAEALLALQPQNPDFLYLLGASSLQAKNISYAEALLAKFATLRPNDSRGCLALGLAYLAQPDKLDAGRQKMESCLLISPRNFEAAYQLGLFYRTQGDTDNALRYFEKTVALSPNYAAALRDFGATLIQAGAEARARPYLERALQLNPDDAETHFQLSRLYNILGDRELGKKHLQIFQKLRTPKKTGM